MAESQHFTPHVIHQLIEAPKMTAPITSLVKQHTETAVAREVKFRDKDIRQEPDVDQNNPPSPLTASSKESYETSKDDEKKDKRNKAHFHRWSLPVTNESPAKDVWTPIG